jgi:hypothetical protein
MAGKRSGWGKAGKIEGNNRILRHSMRSLQPEKLKKDEHAPSPVAVERPVCFNGQ